MNNNEYKSSLEEMYKNNNSANTNNTLNDSNENVNDSQNAIDTFNNSNNTSKPDLLKYDEYKVESVDIDNKSNTKLLDDEILVNAFIGENYPKIESEKFNIFAFLFGGIYLFYRKLFIFGIILQIIQVVLATIFQNYILLIVINVLLGFFFDKLYLYYVKFKIKKIKSDNQDKTLDNLKFICNDMGGVDKKNIFIGILINVLILLIFGVFGLILGFMPNISNAINKINSSSEETEKHDDAFSGIEYNEDVDISSKFNISVLDVFSKSNTSYKYEYLYENAGKVFNDCKIAIGEVSNYKDSNEFINSLVKYYDGNNVSKVLTTKINNINWSYFSYTGSFNTTYLYITKKDGKIYLLEYEIQNNAPDDCLNYKDQIINSISFK